MPSAHPIPRFRGFLERPDASVYYEVTGEGPGLIFAHGLGGNHLSWWQQVPYFADRYTCVAFAHRGFTPSRIAPGGAGPEAFAGDLAALVDRLELKEVSLVCQSMGGWTGLAYALGAPARVKALVLASTSGRVDFTTLTGAEKERVTAWLTSSEGTRVGINAQGIHAALGARGAREQPAAHFLYQEIDALTPVAVKDTMRKGILALRNQKAEILTGLKPPVLYIVGEEDVLFPAEAAPGLARLTPNARVARVAEAGHSVYFERPQQFNRIVDEFLAPITGIAARR